MLWLLVSIAVGLDHVSGYKSPQPEFSDPVQHPWNYSDTQSWAQLYPACNGTRQSPIDIVDVRTFPILLFRKNYEIIPDMLNISNNGYTVSIYPTWNDRNHWASLFFKGVEYRLMSVHWHWGATNNRGSEHTIRGQRYSAEMHMVHGAENGTNSGDDILVLTVLLSTNAKRRLPGLSKVTSAVPNVRPAGSSFNMEPFAMDRLLPKRLLQVYYMYKGSLTTPPCSEEVIFSIASKPFRITDYQLETFRSILDFNGNQVRYNYRPLQERNNREILYGVQV